ncbi:MAG: restriction endonuclease [Lacisediminihabitans sp.]
MSEIATFDATLRYEESRVVDYNRFVKELEQQSTQGVPEAQWDLFKLRFAQFMRHISPITGVHQMTYSKDSKRVVVEFDMPAKRIIPAEKSVRFLKTTGEHRYSYRTDADIKRMYVNFVSQAVLGVLNAVLVLSPESLVDTVAVNAVVEGPDPATGVLTSIPIVSVMVGRSEFEQIRLEDVDPIACLRHLSAVVSRSPAEVAPIRPIVRLDKSDPRFVGDSDVLGVLDVRPNLMELTPTEFEGLVQNLFAKMGLDTKQTRPSRDGGVDAIAYDPRPVLGGKIVIQAKRYKNVVGVSAVRDLFGTLQNEGGSKGILVTTSGYGAASFEFAKNKPLELIDGGNLLFLLKEHAGVDAKIVMPDDWEDPKPQE